MATGIFTASYRFPAGVVRLAGAGPFVHILGDPWCLKVTIRESPTGLTLSLEFDADDPENATAWADRCAVQLASFLTLRWADHIDSAIALQRTSRDFVPLDGADATPLPEPADLRLQGHAPTVRIGLAVEEVSDALTTFELHEAAPPPVFAADLVNAREMYVAAMRTGHPIVRFLILYSAVALFGIFKSRDGGQKAVDRLLRFEDPAIPLVAPPPPRTRPETTYTYARNALIHAEERGKDPTAASAEIARLTPSFRSIVARILLNG